MTTCVYLQALPADWRTGSPAVVCGLLFSIFFADRDTVSEVLPGHEVASKSQQLAFAILDAVAEGLHHIRPSSRLWHRLAVMTEMLVTWFFPASYRTHRTCGPLEALLSCLFAARGLIWRRTRHWTKQAQSILRLFAPTLRAVIALGGLQTAPERAAALVHVIRLQKNLVSGSPGLFGLYQWWNEKHRYTGIGQLSRHSCPHQGGLSKRLLEHLYATVRTKSPEGSKFRYRLARLAPPWSCFFLIVAAGPEAQIRALETFDIRAHRPISNGTQQCFSGVPHVKHARHRPQARWRVAQFGSDSARTIACFDKYCQTAKNECEFREGVECLQFDPWDFSFRDAYRLVQLKTLATSGQLGPINIYDTTMRSLFVLYLASRRPSFTWSGAEAFDKDAALRCALSLKKLKKSHQRRAARRVIDPWLRARGWWPTTFVQVTVPHRVFLNTVRKYVQTAVAHYAKGHVLHAKWIRSRFQLVVGRGPAFRDRWNHAQVARSSVLPVPARVPQVAAPNMRCIERNWRVEERLTPDEELAKCFRQVDALFPGQRSKSGSVHPASYPPALRRHWQSKRDTQDQYEEYTRCFNEHGIADPAIIPDDKNNKYAWVLPKLAYVLLLASFALCTPSWRITSLTEDLANAWIISMLMRVLGAPLASKLGVRAASSVLPYCYVTIKSKCWSNGVRVCRKNGHSCVRKIVSYVKWPRRPLWRSVHRAWETILKHFGRTCDVWSMDGAAQKLQQLQQLPQNPDCERPTCCRCFRDMNSVEGITGDAGQFFEVVDACTAINEARELLAIFTEQSSQSFVTVKHPCKRRQAWFSSAANRFSRKSVTWSVAELFRAFAASMMVCLVSAGDKIFALQSLPIGGLLSKVASSIVLGGQERRWKENYMFQVSEGFRYPAGWNSAVLHLRYVDDILLVSRIYCRRCLAFATTCIYNVPFDIPAGFSNTLVWLDMKLFLDTGLLGLNLKVFCPAPPWHAGTQYLRCLFLGRFRRWRVINPVQCEWRRACLCLLQELRDNRWSNKQVSFVLRSIYKDEYKVFISFCRHAWPLVVCSQTT